MEKLILDIGYSLSSGWGEWLITDDADNVAVLVDLNAGLLQAHVDDDAAQCAYRATLPEVQAHQYGYGPQQNNL
jgi:hypothetical protein